jgi:hypothetical protein
MYFVNGDDEVMKFDGISVYRAGLPRWQPRFASTIDTAAASKISLSRANTASVTASSGSRFTVALGDETLFQDGDVIVDNNGVKYNVFKVSDNSTDGFVDIVEPISGSPTTIALQSVFRYYFRLNVI